MNTGTKIRTALVTFASSGAAIALWKAIYEGVLEVADNMWLAAVVATAVVITVLIIIGVATYYNNDYTETACEYTGLMRQKKLEGDPEYEGEVFFDDIVAEEELDDEHESI